MRECECGDGCLLGEHELTPDYKADPFEPDLFLPYLPSTMEQLVQLSADAESFEGKRRVMNSLNVLIEKMQHRGCPFIFQFVIDPFKSSIIR